LPPPVGLGDGVGVSVGVGVGHRFFLEQQPLAFVPWWQTLGDGVDAGVAVGDAAGLAAAATPETPTSMSAKTPGSSATAARPLGRRRGVSLWMTFAVIDVFQLWS
jgi:hypothetical protein